jgi:hypothetical protein
MAKGNLVLHITDLTGAPIAGVVKGELSRFAGEAGAGGEPREVSVRMGSATALSVSDIPCRGGLGTLYRVSVSAPHFRTYSFFQSIRESVDNTASDDVAFWVQPGAVTGIVGPPFADLDPRLARILTDADMRAAKPEDRDLLGASGSALYHALGPLRKACFLNIGRKASHPSANDCLESIEGMFLCRQDRFFARVDASMPETLRRSPLFKSAGNSLHEPPPGFALSAEGSFKTRDAHANLQVTFMRHVASGALAADIDIDESSGIEHGFEVIRNAAFGRRTNPYLIREFLLSADPLGRSLDPGYRFVF